MKKLERMKKAKKEAHDEEIRSVKNNSAKAGQGLVEDEVPPDEVSESQVQRSMYTSLMTFLPFTNEYYEAKAAEDEMDDLHKIHVEKVRAQDLFTLTKMGKHEEALEGMMAETNRDFFFFNKLKFKMEAEGKFHFEMPDDRNLFTMEKGNRNRLRKAIDQVFNVLDDKLTEELARLGTLGGEGSSGQKRYTNDEPCSWRGKNKSGDHLKCENPRLLRPENTRLQYGVDGKALPVAKTKKKSVPDYHPCCAYHVLYCVAETHDIGENVKIRIPNNQGLCAECYMQQHQKRPANLLFETCPGVVPTTLVSTQNLSRLQHSNESKNKKKGSAVLRRQNQCTWHPSDDATDLLRRYECTNDSYLDPVTNQRYPTCTWHMHRCLRPHADEHNAKITIANQFGLCSMHHVAEHNDNPIPYSTSKDSIYPGMKEKTARDFWKYLQTRHFATPKTTPPRIIITKEYPDHDNDTNNLNSADSGFGNLDTQNLAKWAKEVLHARKVRSKQGRKAAIIIQKYYRRYRHRTSRETIFDRRQAAKRLVACILIQSQMRRFLKNRYFQDCKRRFNHAARTIQRIYRGSATRYLLRQERAARKIQRFMKLLHFFKFRDSVILIMQLKRLFRKRNHLANEIQRNFRGFQGRLSVFRTRLWKIISRSYARKVQQHFRRFVLARKKKIDFRYPDETYVREQVMKRLCFMLTTLMQDKKRKRLLQLQITDSTLPIQKIIRGFLARRGKSRLTFLRSQLFSWFNPHHAEDFLREYLRNKNLIVPWQKDLTPVMVAVLKAEESFIRKYLPKLHQNDFEVDVKVFNVALAKWYYAQHLVLLSAEHVAIVRRFRNVVNGKIMIMVLDEFIRMHPLPCRKHGRRVCGDCVYRRDCNIHSCSCRRYSNKKKPKPNESNVSTGGHKNGICTECDHPINLHALCPFQFRPVYPQATLLPAPLSPKGKKDATLKLQEIPLLEILHAVNEPDMSLPVGVKGTAIESVLVPLLTNDDVREMITTQNSLQLQEKEQNLIESIATCQLCASSVVQNHEYWDQHGALSAVPQLTSTQHLLSKSQRLSHPTDQSLFEPVKIDYHNPNTKNRVTLSNFFETIVSKNPNKKVADYHDGFAHNMPIPIKIANSEELVYTLEGEQLYVNLLYQLIALDESRVVDDHNSTSSPAKTRSQALQSPKTLLAPVTSKSRVSTAASTTSTVSTASTQQKPRRGKNRSHIDSDDSLFLQLILDHIQMFERHWRKFVIDIRAGELTDKHLQLGNDVKRLFKSANLPRPALAKKLDMVFRDLGFHKKVLGKDIANIRPLAEKRDWTLLSLSAASFANSSSLAKLDATLPSSKGNVRATSRGGGQRRKSLPVLEIPSNLLESGNDMIQSTHRPSSKPSHHVASGRLSPLSPVHYGAPSTSAASASASAAAAAAAAAAGSMTKRQLLLQVAAADTAAENASQPTSTASSRSHKRRNSFSDTQQAPLTLEESQSIHYSLQTLSRDKNQYSELVKLNDDRYVCPFPACGASFFSKESGFRHVQTHGQRQRLQTTTAKSDAMLKFYWPEDSPWVSGESFNTRVIPPGAYACPLVAICKESFPTKQKLEAHLRLIHHRLPPSHIGLNYAVTERILKTIPPDNPDSTLVNPSDLESGFGSNNLSVSGLPPFCLSHAAPAARCPVCIASEAHCSLLGLPQAPFRMFLAIKIDFQKREVVLRKQHPELLANQRVGHGGHNGQIMRVGRDSGRVICVADTRQLVGLDEFVELPSTNMLLNPLHILLDRERLVYIGAEPLLAPEDVDRLGIKLQSPVWGERPGQQALRPQAKPAPPQLRRLGSAMHITDSTNLLASRSTDEVGEEGSKEYKLHAQELVPVSALGKYGYKGRNPHKRVLPPALLWVPLHAVTAAPVVRSIPVLVENIPQELLLPRRGEGQGPIYFIRTIG